MRAPRHIGLLVHFISVFPHALCLPSQWPNGHHRSEPTARTLYRFPPESNTWVENIAVRSSGELLITLLGRAELVHLDPFETSPAPRVVHTFSGYSALSGIAEIYRDSFAISVGNFSLTTGARRGSWTVWNVYFNDSGRIATDVNKISDVAEAAFLNGMCFLPSIQLPKDILVGDIYKGLIRRVDTTTGVNSVVIENTLTAVAPDPVFGGSTGVNGLSVKDDILYFVYTAKSIFASIRIHADGTPAGAPVVIRQVHKPEEVFYFDDFAIKGDDAYLVTGSGNSIERIGLDGTPRGRIFAGDLNSTEFAVPTSAAFGRTEDDSHVLYVVTSGAMAAPVDGNTTVGAQVLAVDTRKWHY